MTLSATWVWVICNCFMMIAQSSWVDSSKVPKFVAVEMSVTIRG
jgi:hypothetical protein